MSEAILNLPLDDLNLPIDDLNLPLDDLNLPLDDQLNQPGANHKSAGPPR